MKAQITVKQAQELANDFLFQYRSGALENHKDERIGLFRATIICKRLLGNPTTKAWNAFYDIIETVELK